MPYQLFFTQLRAAGSRLTLAWLTRILLILYKACQKSKIG